MNMSVPVLIFSIAIVVLSVLMTIIVAAQTDRGQGMDGSITGQTNNQNNIRGNSKTLFFKRITVICGILLVLVVAVFVCLMSLGIIE